MIILPLKIEIDGTKAIRGLGVKWTPIRTEVMRSIANFWHERILPKHFSWTAKSEYNQQDRTEEYRKKIKPRLGVGQGRFVYDILKGKSRLWMSTLEKITASSRRATLSMPAPSYFTKPFVGTYTDRRGRQKRIRRQPDKPAEITAMSSRDNVLIEDYLQVKLRSLLDGQINAGSGI